MTFLMKQRILLAKEESVYGSDPTPTVAANALEAKNIRFNYEPNILERDIQRDDLSPSEPVMGKRSVAVSFECELKGSGAQGTAPAIGDLLEACGFTEVVSAGSSVAYSPSSSTMKSVTLYVYDVNRTGSNFKLHKATGCRGNVNFVFEAGQIARAEFSFKGKYNIPTDVSDPGSPTYESTKPPIVQSANFTINSETDLVVQGVNVDMGNEVSDRDDINSSASLKGFEITGRKPNGSFNPEAVTVATYDFWSDWVAATARALSIQVGSTNGNKVTFSAPKVTLDQISDADRNGILTNEVPFRCARNNGNDEVTIAFE